MTRRGRAQLAGLAGLAALAAMVTWSSLSGFGELAPDRLPAGLAALLPLALLIAAGLKPHYKWGLWVAVVMIPYFIVAVTNVLGDPSVRNTHLVITVLTLLTFFAGMDFDRQR